MSLTATLALVIFVAIYEDVTTDRCMAWLASAGFDVQCHHPEGVSPEVSFVLRGGAAARALNPTSVSSELPFVTTYVAGSSPLGWCTTGDPSSLWFRP